MALVRKTSHRPLMTQWLQHVQTLPDVDWANKVCANYKRSLFAAVATLSGVTRKHLEAAADRILMLADDYGCVAVKSLLRDVVLASDSEIGEMPLLEFSLDVFGSAQVFELLTIEPRDGVEHIGITFIKLAKPFEQASEDSTVHLASHLMVQRDRRDSRNVYTVAYEDYGLDDLTQRNLHRSILVPELFSCRFDAYKLFYVNDNAQRCWGGVG